jgi:2-methylisocitrate lyase-like PEP mutase family enzyme
MRPTEELDALAQRLRRLHQPGNPLLLVNVWDVPSAMAVASAGALAVATSSAAVAQAHGAPDDDSGRALAFATLRSIADHVDLPVTGDLEGGYGLAPDDFVAALLDTGAVGCNIEDTDHADRSAERPLRAAEDHAAYLAAIRSAATAAGVAIVINARIDTIIQHPDRDANATMAETVRRARLYVAAGADCVYPIGLRDPATVKDLVDTLGPDVNVNVNPSPSLPDLAAAGAARISTGAGTYRFMIDDLERRARLLLSGSSSAFSN